MKARFAEVTKELRALLRGDEAFLASFSGEEADFARFNRGRVRQAGTVRQLFLALDLVKGRRHVTAQLTLAGEREQDRARLAATVASLRERLSFVPEDPHMLYSTDPWVSESLGANRLPEAGAALEAIRGRGEGFDLVGIYAAGSMHSGFASSLGHDLWSSRYTFHFDWSLYHEKDKAVKTSYAGFTWDAAGFERKFAWAREQLAVLSKPPVTLSPGHYRAYIAPAALNDFLETLSWGGFSLKAHRTRQTPLLRMIEEGAKLHPGFTLAENTAGGVAPAFQAQGFPRPERVELIGRGAYRDCLISPRSAKEYGVPTNGAQASETPLSYDLAAGTMPQSEVLPRLERGLYINNFWYLNYSDRPRCRVTGMTRFATFWVENGAIQAPVSVMRFDETAYRLLGERLSALTREREFIFDANTYGGRSQVTALLPGLLVEDLTLTL